jgi:hypothetical protein
MNIAAPIGVTLLRKSVCPCVLLFNRENLVKNK